MGSIAFDISAALMVAFATQVSYISLAFLKF